VWSIAVNKDGSLLATAGVDRTIKLWNAEGKEQATLSGHKDWVTSVAFSADGTQLISGSYDRTAKIWDVGQKKEVTSIGPLKTSIWSVAFSPDGKLIAVGSHNRLSIWEYSPKERFPAPEAPAE
jgi:WD40 repeat protein